MNVVVDIRSLAEGRHSGVEEYTSNILEGLHRSGEFTVKTFSRWGGVPNRLLNLSQAAARWPRWDSLVDGDVYFAPNFRLFPLTVEKRLVTTVHDLSFERFPELFSVKRRLWHKTMQPKRLLERSDAVIAVSGATKRDVVELYGIPEEKVRVVYSGVTTSPGPALGGTALSLRQGEGASPFVLFLGTLEPRKNIPTLMRAFAGIADTISHDLVIAGARGWLTKEIDSTLRGMPEKVRARVRLPGFVSHDQKWRLLQQADLFVYPSLYEGFGFPPLEALLAGTPVITSCNSSLPEVVGKWATLINPRDTDELALVMQEILKNKEEWQVSEDMKREIRRAYSWDRAAQQTVDILKKSA